MSQYLHGVQVDGFANGLEQLQRGGNKSEEVRKRIDCRNSVTKIEQLQREEVKEGRKRKITITNCNRNTRGTSPLLEQQQRGEEKK